MFVGLVRHSTARHRAGGEHPRFVRSAAFGTALALALVGTSALSAQAAPGDTSNATGQYLSGSLLGLDAGLLVSLGGESATSAGSADQTKANNLNVGVLGAVNLTAPGGIQLPINLGNVGVVEQYASALQNGSSVGASGLTSASGDIGTGITPAPGVAPGPLSLNLAQAVGSLGLPPATINQIAQLSLSAGVLAARAAQTAPGVPAGSYSLANVGLSFQSPTLAGLTTAINNQVTTVQNTVNALAGPSGTIAGALNLLNLGGLTSTTVSVSANDLHAAVAPLLAGPITSAAYPGVSIDLSTGTVTIDLSALTALEGLGANTDLLTDAVITAIGTRISGVVGSLLTQVQNTLTSVTNAITVSATTQVLGLSVLTINETIAQLLAGNTSGITLLGVGLGLPGGLTTVVSALTSPLGALGTAISALGPAVIAPVTGTLIPAIKPVLNGALTLTVNNQSTAAGVFSETALRATVLPAAAALQLNVASATVGVNALAVAPVVTGLTPTHGPAAGGTAVTITGTGFTGATGVTFGGTAGTSFTVVNDTTITVTTPAHAAGAADVVVQSPNGDSAPGTFTFDAAPAVTSVSPTHGPAAGGTVVTITGTGFTGATGVTFGGTAGTTFTVVNDTSITVTTPAHTPGPVDVVVQSPSGDSAPGTFTFDASPTAPVITGLTPTHGPAAGGTAVTITGTGFTGATGVTFGGTAGTTFTVVNDTTITVTTPAHAAGAADVVVQSPNGDSAPGTFTFDAAPAPAITGLTPTSGPAIGGTVVTITGTGFTGATGATFDGTSGTTFTVVNDTTITVTSPAHAPGPVDVVVQSPNGDSAPGTFTYDAAAPTITGLSPTHGPAAGGTVVTITGTGFTGTVGVTFGGTAAASFTVVNDTTITATTPAHAAGATDVVVTTPNGASNAGAFTFDPAPPAITTIVPDHGPETGGTVVTITGTGFTGATGVTFGGTPGTGFTVVNDTTITVTTPAHAAGAADVVVQSPNGDSAPGTFTFDVVVPPVITGLTPVHGPEAGGTVVTITGTGFTGATGVLFGVSAPVALFRLATPSLVLPTGSVPGTHFAVVNDTTITVTSPAHAPGPVDVTVLSPKGDSAPGTFVFDPSTTIDTVDPGSGPAAGGTTVTISGHCFTGATGVLFGTTPATSFTVVDDTTITAVSPAGTGTIGITVVGAPACGTGTLPDAFAYTTSTAPAGASGTSGGLAATGSDLGPSLVLGGFAVLLLIAGVGAVARRTKSNA
ncbi:IPT/TIG domain-containing protein [Leifsonia poae]|uniref:IPT/TIG domain-containing protein n=1 Tax=Leifsonia poae TaxID=110933 RepID=UPI001CC17252|nr:IPT/TIG domain-containing protein [Leifsonia poae]